MTFEFEVNANGWELDQSLWNELRLAAQSAMAETFYSIVRGNFGATGIDRPIEWVPLSDKYAKRVKRDYPTLFLSGDLESSVMWDGSDLDAGVVWTDNPYAVAHQDGSGTLPARPFFPITAAGELTDFAQSQVVEAAETAIAQKLS